MGRSRFKGRLMVGENWVAVLETSKGSRRRRKITPITLYFKGRGCEEEGRNEVTLSGEELD